MEVAYVVDAKGRTSQVFLEVAYIDTGAIPSAGFAHSFGVIIG